MGLKIRVEKTFDQERDAKFRIQMALMRSQTYGLPPIPCVDQAAMRIGCYGCDKIIWGTSKKDLCSDCEKQPVGFNSEG